MSEEIKKIKPRSRPQRWADAISEANGAISQALSAVEDLKGLQEEYREWQDNLPENLQQSAVADKLAEVADFDIDSIESSLQEAESALGDAEGLDLPRGFGKD